MDLDPFVAELLDRPLRASLADFPAATPTREQEAIVRRAFALAHQRLRLPTTVPVFFVDSPTETVHPGETELEAKGRIVVRLSINAQNLYRTALHEAQHVADAHSGLFARLSRHELEIRAIRFAADMEAAR